MTVKTLGDPHLGRVFDNDVPLHRRGERERKLFERFVRELDPDGQTIHVCMGDLFDHPKVSYDVMMQTAIAYTAAAKAHPNAVFIVLRGNHDDSRILTEHTAFDAFAAIMTGRPNVIVVQDEPIRLGSRMFFSWHPIQSAASIVQDAVNKRLMDGVEEVYGHWDIHQLAGEFNMIPTAKLHELGVERAYTGHVHRPEQFDRDGVNVTVVGSMEPLAHGEGVNEDIYITLSLEAFNDYPKSLLKDRCVRVVLKEGENFDGQVPDCLQFKLQRKRSEEAVVGSVEITMDGFDLRKVYSDVMDAASIRKEVRQEVDERWGQTFTSTV